MEKQNVKNFIQVYKDLMTVMGIDIAHSEIQDKHFVFKTNGLYVNGYDYFIEVKDEADLVDIILSQLSYDMQAEIGLEDLENPECEERNIAHWIKEYEKK